MKLQQPFVRLPYSFDVDRLTFEVDQLASKSWLPHPSGMAGNEALPLVSRNAQDNNDFDGAMEPTGHLIESPYIQQCMHTIGEVYGRSRLMALAPGASVTQHVDFNYHWFSRVRIHIPIVTAPEVIFNCGEESIHMEAGSCWIFDSWRHHSVVNNSSIRRIHLVLDTAGSAAFWKSVHQSINGQITLPNAPLAFDSHSQYAVKTERYNSSPVMAPGEMQALVNDLMVDLRKNDGNSQSMMDSLDSTLNDLVFDWRATWSQYGYSSQGIPNYQQLLQRASNQLPSQPRALTTASNDIGATPIVMQRIIRAALRPELIDLFAD